jgi:hypothetical protein
MKPYTLNVRLNLLVEETNFSLKSFCGTVCEGDHLGYDLHVTQYLKN